MIIFLVGGIGSGKSVTAVREIIKTIKGGVFPVTNFDLLKVNNRYHRLKYDDIVTKVEVVDGDKKDKDGNPKYKETYGVNWDFWNRIKKKHKNFSIFLDEAHNIINSRSSMTTRNKVMNKWIAQIRKICGESAYNNIWVITQNSRKIDVIWRDLCQVVVTCNKTEIGKNVYIDLNYWNGMDEYENCYPPVKRLRFKANPYFKFYDSYEIIEFTSNADGYL